MRRRPSLAHGSSSRDRLAVEHSGQIASESFRTGRSQPRVMVMFCDLVGSTELSERHDPERYGLLIERYVREVRATLEDRYGGQIVGVQGDGILALFGAPAAHEDDAERTVRAALEVVDVIHALSVSTQHEWGETLAVRIAIHRGQIYRDLDSVYGLTTNVTARLQGLAPPDGIVISNDVQRMIGRTFETVSMGRHMVKGVTEPIDAHQVISERSDVEARSPFHAPFVGRVREWERLQTMWDEVSTNPNHHGSAVLLQGEAGVGKSYLAARVTQAASDVQAPAVELAGSAFFVDSGLHPVRRLIEHAAGIRNTFRGPERLRLLRSELEYRGLDPGEFIPLLAPVLDIEPDAGYVAEPLDTRKLSATISDAGYRYIGARLGDGPSVLLAQDIQWIDAATLKILERIAHDQRPCMLVMTARPGASPIGGAELIELEPLTTHESALLVDALCADSILGPEDRQSLVARSDGIPLYIEELVAATLHGMPSTLQDDVAARPSGAVPDTLYDLLAARLSSQEDILSIASAAAVIGREVDRLLLQSVLGLTEPDMTRSLELLCERGILESPAIGGGPFRFRHELLREVAYELQPPTQRRLVHGKFAEALTSAADGDVVDWGDAAAHFEKAGRVASAVTSYETAASSARRRGSFSEAKRYLSRSIDLLESGLPHDLERDLHEVELRLQRGYLEVSENGHNSPAAVVDYQRCLELTASDPQGDQWFSTVIVLWTYHLMRGEIGKAQEISDLTYRSLGRREWYRSFNLASFGILECWEGNFRAAKDLLDLFDATRSSEDEDRFDVEWMNPSEPVSGALVVSAAVRFFTGDDAGAARQFAISLERTEGMDFPRGPYSAANALTLEVWMRLELEQFDEADERIDRLSDIAARHGFDSWSVAARMQMTVSAAMRSLATGSASIKECARHAISIDAMIGLWNTFETRYFLPYYLTTAGLLHAAGGDKRLARARLEESLRLAEQTGMHFYDAETLRQLANLELHPQGREKGLRKALELARRQNGALFEVRAAIDLADLCGSAEKSVLETALAGFDEGSRYPELARARDVLERLG